MRRREPTIWKNTWQWVEVEPKYHRPHNHRILEVPSPTWLGYTLQQPQRLLEAAGVTPLGPVEGAASLCAVPILHPPEAF